MEVVLDSVSLNHLLKKPKKVEVKGESKTKWETALDAPIRQKKLCLVLDVGRGLHSEWERTCSKDAVEVVVTRWNDLSAIRPIALLPSIEPRIMRRLRTLGFDDTVDKVVLKLGLAAKDHIVISDDSDFWNPKTTDDTGDNNAPVAQLCREELGVIISLLSPLLKRLSRASTSTSCKLPAVPNRKRIVRRHG